ncbi:MAG: dephospho-CoA kinase, partial [Ruthenibacterium sp.]
MSARKQAQEPALKKSKDEFRVVAVTGRSGSGKSTVTAHFAALGYPTLDADRIAHDIARTGSPCLAQLVRVFGADILDEKGALRRAVLAQRAFETPQSTQRLTDITHPAIVAQLLAGAAAAKESGAPLVFVDGAVIVGGMFEQYCDF